MPPFRFLVYGCICKASQGSQQTTPDRHDLSRESRSRRCIHERHELIREARHGAADADPPDIRATSDSIHPTALGYVAVYHGSPAPDLYQALGRAVFVGEVGLL